MSKWPVRPLGELCEIVGGGTPRRDTPEFFGGDINWATPTDVTALDRPEICSTKERITMAGLKNSSTKLLPTGSVLLTSRATIGFTAVTQVPMCTNQGFANFICGSDILPEFLAFWLPSQKEKMLQLAGGTTFKEISKSSLKTISIPLPPLPEQRRIVDIFNHATGICRLRRQALDTAHALIPALFAKMFGDPASNPRVWDIWEFGNLGDCRLGKMLDKKKHTGFHSKKYLRNQNVQWNRIDYADVLEMDILPEEQETFRLKNGDVLICEGGEVGRAAIWHGQLQECYFQKALHRMRPNPDIATSEYIVSLLWRLAATGALHESTTHSTIAHLTGIKLKRLKVPLPPLSLQQAFADRVTDIRSLITKHERHLAQSEALMQSLMARYFGNSIHN